METLIDIYFNSTVNYVVTRTEIEGKSFLIVPVVMIVEGVHHGSHGKILHLIEELQKSVPLWNNRPVTISHPQINGNYVSAEEEEVQDWKVGYVTNVRIEEKKLKAEVYLDEQRLIASSPELLKKLNNGEEVEVSVGIFAEDEIKEGEWNNEEYEIIARNHKPDHLALLPGEIGACSIADGCGIRVNKKGGKNVNVGELKQLLGMGHFSINKDGYQEIVEKMWNHLYSLNDDSRSYYLVDVFDSHVIYRVQNRSDDSVVMFKQNYELNDDGSIKLIESGQKVRRDVKYIEVNKIKKEVKMCDKCPEKVDLLIENSATHFNDDDRVWLDTLTEDKLDKLIPKRVRVKTPEPEEKEITVQEAVKVIQANAKSDEDYFAVLPDDVRKKATLGLSTFKEKKDALMQKIIDNTDEGVWTKEELDVMSMDVLEKLEKSIVKSPENYAGKGGGTDFSKGPIAPMPIQGVEFKN